MFFLVLSLTVVMRSRLVKDKEIYVCTVLSTCILNLHVHVYSPDVPVSYAQFTPQELENILLQFTM